MTKLNLSEASLLEASGELGEATRERLHAYLQRHPEVRPHYEQVQREFELLRSNPALDLSPQMRQKISASIKTGIQQKLRARHREEQSRRRWKLIYQSLAGISAAAAALIIVGGLWVINTSISERREQDRIYAVDWAVRTIQSANRRGDFEYQVADVNESIDQFQDQVSPVVAQDDVHRLMSTLATLASEREEIMPPPEPGAL